MYLYIIYFDFSFFQYLTLPSTPLFSLFIKVYFHFSFFLSSSFFLLFSLLFSISLLIWTFYSYFLRTIIHCGPYLHFLFHVPYNAIFKHGSYLFHWRVWSRSRYIYQERSQLYPFYSTVVLHCIKISFVSIYLLIVNWSVSKI